MSRASSRITTKKPFHDASDASDAPIASVSNLTHAEIKAIFDDLDPDAISDKDWKALCRDFYAVEWQYCKENPYYWLTSYVWTLDPHDKEHPVKPFPDKDYLRVYAAEWVANQGVIVPKSRQILITWETVGLYTHDSIFFNGRLNLFQSKKEDDADKLVKRVEHIYNNLPAWQRRRVGASFSYCSAVFSNQSQIIGIPQGGDQIRMHTASGVFIDEAAIMPEAGSAFTASQPCIEGGGRLTMVSTAKPSWFCFFVTREGEFKDVTIFEEILLMEGVTRRRRSDSYVEIEIRYVADPAKNPLTEEGAAWYARARGKSTAAAWNQEYEIDWFAMGGEPIYPMFSREKHVVAPFEIPSSWTRYMALDPGLRNPTGALWIALDPHDRAFVYDEHYVAGEEVKVHAGMIKEKEKFHTAKMLLRLIDPSACARSIVNKKIIRAEYAKYGIHCISANNDVNGGIEMVTHYLNDDIETGEPSLFIFSSCTHTIDEIIAYTWQEQSAIMDASHNPKESPKKVFDHLMDCLRYLLISKPRFLKAVRSKRSAFHSKSRVYAGNQR